MSKLQGRIESLADQINKDIQAAREAGREDIVTKLEELFKRTLELEKRLDK